MERSMKATVTSCVAIALFGLAGACSELTPVAESGVERMSAAQLLARVCAKCHGPEGVASLPTYPHLAGQQADYLALQLMSFRDHSRSDPLAEKYMWEIARRLSDAQIQGLANLLGAKTAAPGVPGDAAEMAAGRSIYLEGINRKGIPPCVMCHGPNGEGFGAFPRLAHQQREYLANQLRIFKSGRGRSDTPMSAVAPNLSEAEIQSVAAYLQGMPATR
jgi:cytochrome c553